VARACWYIVVVFGTRMRVACSTSKREEGIPITRNHNGTGQKFDDVQFDLISQSQHHASICIYLFEPLIPPGSGTSSQCHNSNNPDTAHSSMTNLHSSSTQS
jgi:hypothetical protein